LASVVAFWTPSRLKKGNVNLLAAKTSRPFDAPQQLAGCVRIPFSNVTEVYRQFAAKLSLVCTVESLLHINWTSVVIGADLGS
jgi:hypothetical protein